MRACDSAVSCQVSAVLAYSHENAVEPFLEPVLGLCQALLDRDQQDMHRNMDGMPSPPSSLAPHSSHSTVCSPPTQVTALSVSHSLNSQHCL